MGIILLSKRAWVPEAVDWLARCRCEVEDLVVEGAFYLRRILRGSFKRWEGVVNAKSFSYLFCAAAGKSL